MSIQCALTGRVTQEPTPRTTQRGMACLTLSVAVAGDEQKPQYVSVTLWDTLAHDLHGALHTGDQVFVTGVVRLGQWTGRDGVERTGLNCSAATCVLLFAEARPAEGRRHA